MQVFEDKRNIVCGIALYFIIIIGLLVARNELAPNLLKHANYGMPALINRGKASKLYIGSSRP